jgi:hypothetical protein
MFNSGHVVSWATVKIANSYSNVHAELLRKNKSTSPASIPSDAEYMN